MRRLAALFAVGVGLASCAQGEDVTGGAGNGGAAGTASAGAAGTSGGGGTTGAAGTSGGGSGTTGTAGNGGLGGTTGGAGTTGAAGRGGTTGGAGTTGAAGRGGTTGTAGTTGAAGMAGAAGRGGTTGTAGTGAGGQGNLPGGVTSLFPPPNGQGLCPDPPLRITFSGAPTIGTSGSIRVLTSGGSAVTSVDVGASSYSITRGGMTFTIQRPVYVDGNAVVVYLPAGLGYGQTYYVNVDSGAIKAPGGASLAITDSTTWRFSTAAAAPTNRAALGVALDGSGPFCSVQGAIDLVPASNTSAVTITIATGIYHEIVYFKSKSNVTFMGQDRNGTVIEGTNNNNLNPSTKGRALFGADSSNTVSFRNLTIKNQTPQGGSQAEALRLEGCDKCVVRDATIISLQDTLLWSGRIYANNCLIEGNVDFVWGTGAVYFVSSEIRTIGRSGPIVQARNGSSTYGYVFVDSKLTSDAGLTGGVLARIDAGVYPASHVAYINCSMTNEITAAGWQLTAGTATSALRFWEYQSVDASGNPIDVSKRLAGSMQLSSSQAAMMRDPTVVLAGWQPPAN
jgi:pectin methylesterase-like acyl-CoA thioesterase